MGTTERKSRRVSETLRDVESSGCHYEVKKEKEKNRLDFFVNYIYRAHFCVYMALKVSVAFLAV